MMVKKGIYNIYLDILVKKAQKAYIIYYTF